MTYFRLALLCVAILHTASGNKLGETCAYFDYVGKEFNASEVSCPDNDVCNAVRTISVSYIHFPPFFYENQDNTSRPIQEILRMCCGGCARVKEVNIFKNISEVSAPLIESSDFIYPIIASSSTEMLHGYRFIPFVDIPQIMYICERHGVGIGAFVRKVYPITMLWILLCIVSGFICWLLESRGNEEEFPRQFLVGWFEGFWWSFITMTTVGYGDKSPRTILGRIFTVIWISLGLVCCALVMGVVYNEVMKVDSPPPPGMKGEKVGSLLYRDYDAYVVAEMGGTVVRNEALNPTDFYMDVLQLIGKLDRREISGFVLDEYTATHMEQFLKKFLKKLELGYTPDLEPITDPVYTIKRFLRKELRTPIFYNGAQKLTYGALVKHNHDYAFLKDVIKAHRFHNSARKSVWISQNRYDANAKDRFVAKSLFAPESKFFRFSIITVFVLILGICLFGILSELKRRGWRLRRGVQEVEQHEL